MLTRLTAVLLYLALSAPAAALTIEYATNGRSADLVKCDMADYHGRRDEARRCYSALLTGQADVRVKAEAARALGDLKSANTYFRTAIQRYPKDPAVRTRWGELYAQTHQDNEAVRLFEEALKISSDYAPAKLGLAEVSVDRFENKARQWLDEVLHESPDSIRARLLLARMDLENGSIDAADKLLDQALAIAQKTSNPPLEIYALKASVDLLRGVWPSPWTKKALAYNPGYGEAYATPAYYYVITRRYRKAIDLYERAVAVEPDLYSAQADLGVNLLRVNKIAEAQQHLAIAYRGDPFSARIVNTLRLIDSFRNFVVVKHTKDARGRPLDPPVILRLNKNEADVLTPYALDLAERAIKTYTKAFDFKLTQPVVIEMYPVHDDFAVRTAGLPGIGLLGVTFGYLLAMDSPSARKPGEFHWGTTLWHELAHVFTLTASDHLIPRWFSEGISVYEEWSTGPLHGRHIPPEALAAFKAGKMLPVADLDRGFIHPTYESQVIVSYMQAGLICEYIAKTYGAGTLGDMVKAYGRGLDTPQVIREALKLSTARFDERFDAYVKEQLGSVLDHLDAWQTAQGEANKAAQKGDWQEALTQARRAIELNPAYVDPGSAYLVEARAEQETGHGDAAVRALATYYRLGGYEPAALRKLAQSYGERGNDDKALDVLESLRWDAPFDEKLHSELGDRLLAAGRPKQALAEYQELAAMKPHDTAALQLKLAKAYLGMDDRARARQHLLYALEIAPDYKEAQQLLLEIVR
jgi:tetratricopeptide (TPR) repeat protein